MVMYQYLNNIFLCVLIAANLHFGLADPKLTENDPCFIGEKIVKPLRFTSPLQTYTIFSKCDIGKSPRDEFLPKFKAGITAESIARDSTANNRETYDDGEVYHGKGWEKSAEESDKLKEEENERRVERFYDRYISRLFPSEIGTERIKFEEKSRISKYQVVGVVRPPNAGGKNVDWYVRKRPVNSKWILRLVHANVDAILRDMFIKGKIDIYGEYNNKGLVLNQQEREVDYGQVPITGRPLIEGKYTIKERSWRNLWNFSPRHFFTDSSGSFWRQRRLLPGLYTDGRVVFESSYRYTDGKNGMKPISGLDELLDSDIIKKKTMVNLLHRLKNNAPDIVVEY